MGQASASAATGIDNQGAGNLSVNAPNYVWVVVIALGLVLAAFVYLRKK